MKYREKSWSTRHILRCMANPKSVVPLIGFGNRQCMKKGLAINAASPWSLASEARIGLTGVEPALPKKLEPKSSASASSATAPGSEVGNSRFEVRGLKFEV